MISPLISVKMFEEFVQATGYETTAQKNGFSRIWSVCGYQKMPGLFWRDSGAAQSNPEGVVVHVSIADARAYADWRGALLLEEQAWINAVNSVCVQRPADFQVFAHLGTLQELTTTPYLFGKKDGKSRFVTKGGLRLGRHLEDIIGWRGYVCEDFTADTVGFRVLL